jgi:ribosome-binding protein aMBF1 (putative translation factor)
MKTSTKKRLEEAGFQIGTAAEFLDLTPEEAQYVEMKVSLARALKSTRSETGLTQTDLASRSGSSQSRIARMESADASVSLDLIIRALLHAGASREEIAAALAGSEPSRTFRRTR